MVPSGPPGGGQSIPPSLLRSNSALMGGQGGSVNSLQNGFNMQQRNQFNGMNMLANGANVSSLLHQSFGNGGPGAALSGPGSSQRGVIDNGAESDQLSTVNNGMGFNPHSSSFSVSNMGNPNNSGQVQGQQFANSSGNQMFQDQQGQQLEAQKFQHNQQVLQQFPASNNIHQQQQLQQQIQYQSVRGGMGGIGPVKLEPQMTNDQHGQSSLQLQAMRNLNVMKLEPQQVQAMRGLAPVKIDGQHSDQSYMHPQQHQQLLQMSRQAPQAAQINLLHQQRLMLQHQQQLLKANTQQRSPLQSQFQPQNLPARSPPKPVYEPGMCARRLTHYMYQQQHRPEDNNIEFWRKFVAEYFTPNAKKKWCVSMYGNGRQTTGVFPQDVWHCEICNRKPGRGFEATADVLPRLFKIKYESGTLEELLYVDMPQEYQNSSGQIVLDYVKAIQESVFEQLRVVREGKLRLVFSSDLKICSWEFCARHHEELIPRRLLIPQVSQLGAAAQKYQAATQIASPNLSVPELQNNCNMFVASARQLAKALEVPLVNDLGYTKRYVRCLQISEVVNSMGDLIDYSLGNGIGPMESLAKFPRRTGTFSGSQTQQPDQQLQQRPATGNSNNEDSVQATIMQMASTNNGIQSVNNSLNSAPATSSTSTIAGLINHKSMNSRQQNPGHSANSPYGGGGSQIPSPGSSATIPQVQSNHSPFQSPTPSATNNPPQTSQNGLTASAHMNTVTSPNNSMQQPAVSGDPDPNDSQSSVQKIIHDMMMSSQLGGTGMAGGGSLGNEMKNANRLVQSSSNGILGGGNSLVANGNVNGNSGIGVGFGNMGNGLGARGAMLQNSTSMNGRVGMTVNRDQNVNNHQQQDMSMLNGLGAVNGFNGLQFDWKSSP
ncbi:Transcriptional corepressor SEUSS [Heracleum sosnowskyi]|uniref:Transcriptional corepressor SEUSS n=1 Tax=Heracleum sosnowskyi TaxID=360622 RepID=A0AAD8ND96_9APIA|nr:Transcriptional corepressor SEUSS [Heracleum sosnowskyi]